MPTSDRAFARVATTKRQYETLEENIDLNTAGSYVEQNRLHELPYCTGTVPLDGTMQ